MKPSTSPIRPQSPTASSIGSSRSQPGHDTVNMMRSRILPPAATPGRLLAAATSSFSCQFSTASRLAFRSSIASKYDALASMPPADPESEPARPLINHNKLNGIPEKDRNVAVALRTYTPRTPGVRHLRRPINDHLWKGRAFLPLTIPKRGHGKGGRNSTGRITVRHRGGGVKTRIRSVDFHRMTGGPHVVERIEHDPGRSAHIALLTEEATGQKSYIVAPEGTRAGDVLYSYRAGIPQDMLQSMGGVVDPGVLAAKTAHRGNCLPLHLVPLGTPVFNVGSHPKGGAVFCRSAGTFAIVESKDEETKADGTKVMTGKYVTVRLQSNEVRKVSKDACATIGVASNTHHHYRQLGKAGRKRWLNVRPTVRGVAMNKGAYSFCLSCVGWLKLLFQRPRY